MEIPYTETPDQSLCHHIMDNNLISTYNYPEIREPLSLSPISNVSSSSNRSLNTPLQNSDAITTEIASQATNSNESLSPMTTQPTELPDQSQPNSLMLSPVTYEDITEDALSPETQITTRTEIIQHFTPVQHATTALQEFTHHMYHHKKFNN